MKHYHFNNVRDGVSYRVLLSTDLVDWTDPPFAELTNLDPTPVLIPAAQAVDGKLFIRLQVTEDP